MNGFHFFIIKDFNLRLLSSKRTPLLKRLILTAKVTSWIILIMFKSCLLISIVPLYRPVTVASNKLFGAFRFPFKTCTWVSCQTWCITDIEYFTLINVVHTDFSVRTCSSDKLVICTYLQWKNLSVNITEKVYYAWFVLGISLVIEFQYPRTEGFLLDQVLSMFE